MNISDSSSFAEILDDLGFERSKTAIESDLVVINTCVVRAKAEDKAISYIGEMEKIRRSNGKLRVILAGCLSPLSNEINLKGRFSCIQFSINPQDIDNFRKMIIEHLGDLVNSSENKIMLDSKNLTDLDKALTVSDSPYHVFVNIMRGCEQHCTFCIVPKTRGKNFSHDESEIIDKIRQARDRGIKSITLLGQSIMDYGKDWVEGKSIKSIKGDDRFRELLDKVSSEFPDLWIKFLTSHPKDCTLKTIDLISERSNISKFIHLPIQSGDNTILKKMGRGHTREYYLELAEYIQKRIPDVILSSDIIVGFPGEGEEEFENSIDLLAKVRFHKLFTFQYSPRQRTPAARFNDDVLFEEKRLRLNHLIDFQNNITLERHKELVGTEMDIIYEGPAKGEVGNLMGRSLSEDIIIFSGGENLQIGDKIRVRITEGNLRTLSGKPIGKSKIK